MHVTIAIGVNGPRLLVGAGEALLRRDYSASRQLAQQALASVPVGSTTPEAQFTGAQARFIQALALLDGKAVIALPNSTFKQIEALLDQCLTTLPRRPSYIIVLGELYQQLKQVGFTVLAQKGKHLLDVVQTLPLDAIDQQNLAYYWAAQPQR